jgi:hypothetical protein
MVSYLCPAGLDCDTPIYTSCVAEMTDMHHYAQPLVEMGGSLELLPGLALNINLPDPCLLSSWDYRLEPLHSAQI